MNHRDQIMAFANDLDNLVSRYASEFELPYASAVGVLHMKIYLIEKQASDEADDDGE